MRRNSLLNTVAAIINSINEFVAVKMTIMVSSIWAFYIFVIYGFLPFLIPHEEQNILYWSNFLQLIFLPIITVGAAILGRNSEKRQDEDHENIIANFNELHVNVDKLNQLLKLNTEMEEIISTNKKLLSESSATLNTMHELLHDVHELTCKGKNSSD